MGLSCGATMAKIFLFIFNFIFFLSGGALLGIGVLFKVDHTVTNFLRIIDTGQQTSYMEIAAWVLIGVGGFIFAVSFLGCCGACCESTCCLCLYALLLFVVMLAEVGAGILAAIYKGEVQTFLKESMLHQVKYEYDNDKSNPLTIAWDFTQVELNCCGANGPRDYDHSKFYNSSKYNNLPKTCCILKNKDPKNPEPKHFNKCMKHEEGFVKKQGCYQALLDWVTKHSGMLIGIGCGIAGIQIFSFTLGCCLRTRLLARDEKFFDDV